MRTFGDCIRRVYSAGGALTAIVTAQVGTGNHPTCITVDPTGHYVYVTNLDDDTVSQYTIGTGGALSGIGTIGTGTQPNNVTIDPNGLYAYVANTYTGNGFNTISQYTIGMGGALSAMNPDAFAEGSFPWFVTVDPSGRYAYVANFGFSTVSLCTIGAGGAISGCPASYGSGTSPYYITVDPTGHFVYVANYDSNSVSEYSLGTGGALSGIGTIATGSEPVSIAVTN